MALWTEIRENQYLIVGIIGLVGVMYTLWYNARQARKMRREERCHERQTLRVALIEELKINRHALVQSTDTITEGSETADVLVPTDLMDDTYRAFTHRIGLLSQAEVRKVMSVYLSLRTLNAKLFLIGVPGHTSNRHVAVSSKNASMLSRIQQSLIGPIDEAIEVMESARDTG